MKEVIICANCSHHNHIDNFLCGNCGFDFDLQITENEFGLPEIEF
jgi:transcription elongation factor Elf1